MSSPANSACFRVISQLFHGYFAVISGLFSQDLGENMRKQ